MITLSIQYRIILQSDIDSFSKSILIALHTELCNINNSDHLTIKAIRLFDILKTTLKSKNYKVNTAEILKIITEQFKFDNIHIQEQILCICAIIASKSRDISEDMIDLLAFVDKIYSKTNTITDEIAQTVNYFCQNGWEHLSENTGLLETFIKIGIKEVTKNNANAIMHLTQGTIFLQSLFINLHGTDSLTPYIPELTSLCTTTITDRSLLLTLLWYDAKTTIACLDSLNYTFTALSSIITHISNLKFTFPTKL